MHINRKCNKEIKILKSSTIFRRETILKVNFYSNYFFKNIQIKVFRCQMHVSFLKKNYLNKRHNLSMKSPEILRMLQMPQSYAIIGRKLYVERRNTGCRPNGLCSNSQSIAMKVNMGTQRAAERSQAWTTAVSRPAQEGPRPYLKVLPWAGLVTQW